MNAEIGLNGNCKYSSRIYNTFDKDFNSYFLSTGEDSESYYGCYSSRHLNDFTDNYYRASNSPDDCLQLCRRYGFFLGALQVSIL